ncbi:DUF6456 domain-containing protein [Rhizobium sp. AAP43]|uniref:DUF6456 domain-containing protein n=1 Tax=Rhizobium sp. AAP43 TaxID=1523420 RepID=UPI0006B889B4|nr:DUF6456 domain-containing protein [Rhizobium sp. AAP43]
MTLTIQKTSRGKATGTATLKGKALPRDQKPTRRLLRLLLDGPLTVMGRANAEARTGEGAKAAAPVAMLRLGRAPSIGTMTDLTVDAGLLAGLAARGLIARTGSTIAATPETASYLRRALCDLPEDSFAAQHRQMETVTEATPEGRRVLRRNRQESPLYPLLKLKEKDGRAFLPEEAVLAGDRLAADFEYGGLQPRITASWEPRLATRVKGQAPDGPDLADSRLAARARLNRAIAAMGPELAGVALDVCCFGKGLEVVERERQWPARSAKLMLRTALLALARHYAPPQKPTRTRHWGEEGYRPDIAEDASAPAGGCG